MKNNPSIMAVGKNIKLVTNKISLLRSYMFELVAILLFAFGSVGVIKNSLGIEFDFNIFVSILISTTAMMFIFKLKRFLVVGILGVFGVIVVSILTNLRYYTMAIFYINKLVVGKINIMFSTNYTYYFVDMSAQELRDVQFLISIALPFLLCFLCAAVTVNTRMPMLMFIISSLFIYMGVFLVEKVSVFPLILIVLSILINYALQTSLMNVNTLGKELVSYKGVKRRFYVLSDYKFASVNMISTLIVFVIVAITATIALASFGGFNTSSSNKTVLDYITKAVDFFSVENSRNIFESLTKKDADSGISGGGELGKNDTIKFKNEVHLKVKLSENIPTYFKGFVGELYSNNRWSKMESSQRETALYSEFNQYIPTPLYYSAPFAEYLSNNQAYQNDYIAKEIETEIYNVSNNRKFVFQPYFLSNIPVDDIYYTDDAINSKISGPYKTLSYGYYDTNKRVTTIGNDEYGYYSDVYSPDFLANQNNTEKVSMLNKYANFAYSEYTKLPIGELARLNGVALSLLNTTNDSIYSKAETVRNYLESQAKYSISPGKTPDGEDFAEYFLFTAKKGYCTHFATTATLILRGMGVPARYVEGYAVHEKELKKVNKDTGIIEVPDTCAHAWVEIFDPYIGWVPIEVTPGFSIGAQVESSDMSSDISSAVSSNNQANPSEISSVQSQSSVETSQASQVTSQIIASDSEEQEISIVQSNKKPNIIVYIIILIAVIVGLIVLGYFALKRYRKLMFSQSNRNKAVIEIYSYITKLTAKKGVVYHNDIEQYAKTVEENLNISDFMKTTDIVLKARFSKHTITEQEYDQVLNCLYELE